MPKLPTPITLSTEERTTLRAWQRAGSTEHRMVERADMILRAAQGQRTDEIAAALRTRPARVSKWRTRFARQRLRGLTDGPRAGAPRRYDGATERRILAGLDQPPPRGHATWTGTLLGVALGDVSPHQVWRVLKRHGISLRRRRSWGISTDPEFARKAADVVGSGDLENNHQGRDARDEPDDRRARAQTIRVQNNGAVHHDHARDEVEKEKHKEIIHPFGKRRIVRRRAQADFLDGEAVYSVGKNESNNPAPTSAMPR